MYRHMERTPILAQRPSRSVRLHTPMPLPGRVSRFWSRRVLTLITRVAGGFILGPAGQRTTRSCCGLEFLALQLSRDGTLQIGTWGFISTATTMLWMDL